MSGIDIRALQKELEEDARRRSARVPEHLQSPIGGQLSGPELHARAGSPGPRSVVVATARRLVGRVVRSLAARIESPDEPQPVPNAAAVAAAVQALSGASGRVLHACAGDGRIVEALLDGGLDAYGVEPSVPDADDADGRGIEVHLGDPVDHLRAVRPAVLGGALLSGCVDGLPRDGRLALVDGIARALAEGGRLVVLGRAAGQSDAWVDILRSRGFAGLDVAVLSPADWHLVSAVRGPAS